MTQHEDIFDHVARRGSGVIALPRGRGIIVGTDPSRTPPGWGFARAATPEAEAPRLRELAAFIDRESGARR